MNIHKWDGDYFAQNFPFSSKFPDLQFAPYVLYNLFTHVVKPHTWHKQWAWITCGERNGKQTWRRSMSFIVSIRPNCLKQVQFLQQITKIMRCEGNNINAWREHASNSEQFSWKWTHVVHFKQVCFGTHVFAHKKANNVCLNSW